MAITIQRSGVLCDSEFEKELLTKIGDGEKSIFIEESPTLKNLLNTFFKDIAKDFVEDTIDGTIKIQRKIGLVYSPNINHNLFNKMDLIWEVTPHLKYNKGDEEISTIDYIKNYEGYAILLKDKNYNLNVVMYAEVI